MDSVAIENMGKNSRFTYKPEVEEEGSHNDYFRNNISHVKSYILKADANANS
jgi:hypothetical protein